ncbi:MAG: hypothetical protein J6M16_10095 [Clostridia bacterium]|nr:hypothetical protein [Clostridia bacterium]
MAYIRKNTEELTGYQQRGALKPSIDLCNDFVMVYGIGPEMPAQVKTYQDAGYVVHLMTGVAWGQYQDYLNGDIDGREHWDEAQVNRNGDPILHGATVPYMVPTVAFSDYLMEKLKPAIDAGVVAIHLEEPEFWDYGGYSEAFKREYEIYYREKWTPPHENVDVRYKASKLKAYLYARIITRLSSSLKEYAKVKYDRDLRFYIPTHSLLNYTQWKIMSPEAALIDIPTVDGCIAQIWTGTSRPANVYNGIYKERTFETAFLEYGIMQELVKGTGRRMWFLHDPIEDKPAFTWENYEYNYLKTAVASLLHPAIHHYEICPWPQRVFEGIYPRPQFGGIDPEGKKKKEKKFIPVFNPAGDSFSQKNSEPKAITEHYSTLLSSMFQMFGDMDQEEYAFEGVNSGVGVLMSDSGLFQRTMADGVVTTESIQDRLAALYHTNDDPSEPKRDDELMELIDKDDSVMYDFIQSPAFPNLFGMAMPLLKYGLPVRPVQLDNIRRFTGYLNDYKTLILSYEYMKPESPDVNMALATWVMGGGSLIYIGDGSDPYHKVDLWWKKSGYADPALHLFELLGFEGRPENGIYNVGKGKFSILNKAPARLGLSTKAPEDYRSFVKAVLEDMGETWEYKNDLTLHRGPYIISSVMDESVTDEPKVFKGLFADILDNQYKIITEKVLKPDDNTILYNLDKIAHKEFEVIGTAARIFSLDLDENGFEALMKTADNIKVYTRLRLPKAIKAISAVDEDGNKVDITFENDEVSRTSLISYLSKAKKITVKAEF